MNQHLASCLTGNDNVTSPVPVCTLGFFRNSLSSGRKMYSESVTIFTYEAFILKSKSALISSPRDWRQERDLCWCFLTDGSWLLAIVPSSTVPVCVSYSWYRL